MIGSDQANAADITRSCGVIFIVNEVLDGCILSSNSYGTPVVAFVEDTSLHYITGTTDLSV